MEYLLKHHRAGPYFQVETNTRDLVRDEKYETDLPGINCVNKFRPRIFDVETRGGFNFSFIYYCKNQIFISFKNFPPIS